MTVRTITRVTQRGACKVIELDCGHSRSIGGGKHHDGQTPHVLDCYDCQDGHCCAIKKVFADNP